MPKTTKQPKARAAVALHPLVMQQLTPGQRTLVKKHGTVSEFAIACHMCVPSDISYDEAEAAIQKYRREFNAA